MASNIKTISWYFALFFLFLNPCVQAEIEMLDTSMDSEVVEEKSISMDLQDASLNDVLKIFSIQSGLNFIASEAVQDRKITLFLDKVPIKDAMTKLFKANRLNYEFDAGANMFIVTASEDMKEAQLITRVYRLKYRSVSTSPLEQEKRTLFSSASTVSGKFSSSGRASSGSSAGNSTKGELFDAIKQVLSKDGKISEDNKSNSIIVTDIASRFASVEEIISRLDVPQPQVMLEVEMLDVSKNAVDNIGFQITSLQHPSPLTWIIPGSLSGSVFQLGGEQGAGQISSYYSENSSIYPGSVMFGHTYSSVLNLLSMQSDTRFLARPRLLTLNNETAEIGVTKDQVVTKQETVTYSGNNEPTVNTTFERATALTLTPEGIGIYLRVTPTINIETGEVTLVLNPKASTVSLSPILGDATSEGGDQGERSGVTAYDPEVRSTKSIVKIRDGDTVVLGGLIHREKNVYYTKVPFLGDIPIVGAFFRNKKTGADLERELLVFITPHIVKEQGLKFAQSLKPGQRSGMPLPAGKSSRSDNINAMLGTFER